MLISKENRRKIYESLFKEGVLVAKKDFYAPKHMDIEVPNLEVIKAMQSLNSRGFVATKFSWQYYYYTLTNEGLDYLREWLHLPAEIVPATHKKQLRPQQPRSLQRSGEGAYKVNRDREEYRRKEPAVPGDFNPNFRSGFGRGRAPQ
ncbi:40S ribosomal protein S10-B [Neolecta irregularis DAH-3]|uniref:40S ribosomal protein S10-B n=2 Tax=Neolecta irregularis (strain DAH-3) TaxID=1198029 RepID=A0A1U7LJK2_NEOID|nr:40S ribosomal protein S10-B [Neolecta irregularis DAH-3]|eukprot:OLL22835.1 40S ribosomal protein S10-B [Neolecta irregularis DAH-3]